jgi:hypothetical protein
VSIAGTGGYLIHVGSNTAFVAEMYSWLKCTLIQPQSNGRLIVESQGFLFIRQPTNGRFFSRMRSNGFSMKGFRPALIQLKHSNTMKASEQLICDCMPGVPCTRGLQARWSSPTISELGANEVATRASWR